MMGDVPHPTTVFEYIFVVVEFLVAVLRSAYLDSAGLYTGTL